jgi:hypothetical protein
VLFFLEAFDFGGPYQRKMRDNDVALAASETQ